MQVIEPLYESYWL
jgi:putative transposase